MIAPFTGSFLYLQHKKNVVRKEIREKIINGIDQENLVLLQFEKGDLDTRIKWIHEREFEWQHNRYDVVEILEVGNQIHIWCWPDEKETQVNRQIKKLLTDALGKDPLNKKNHEQLRHFFKSLYIEKEFSWNTPISEIIYSDIPFCGSHYYYLNEPPPSPPPQIA